MFVFLHTSGTETGPAVVVSTVQVIPVSAVVNESAKRTVSVPAVLTTK